MNEWNLVRSEIEQRENRVPQRRGEANKPRPPSAAVVALRERQHGTATRATKVSPASDIEAQLAAEFQRGGLTAEGAAGAVRGRAARPVPQTLYEAGIADGMSPAAAKAFARGRHGLNEVVKNVAGLPASCFAWVPDPEDPLTWQLQIARSADNGSGEWSPDEDLVRAAVAQVPGIAGYDQALDIPAAALPGVRSILRSAWIACGAAIEEMPSELNQEALRREFRRGGLSEQKAAIAARGREGRR